MKNTTQRDLDLLGRYFKNKESEGRVMLNDEDVVEAFNRLRAAGEGMEYRKVSAVREFNEHGLRWYPAVYCERSTISAHPHYVRPDVWIQIHCPDGFDTPQAAILAGKRFTGECE